MKGIIASIVLALAATTLTSAFDLARADAGGADRPSVSALDSMHRGDAHGSGLLDTEPRTYQAQACCKVCRQGKACGDTCISRDKQCHVGPGCACDG